MVEEPYGTYDNATASLAQSAHSLRLPRKRVASDLSVTQARHARISATPGHAVHVEVMPLHQAPPWICVVATPGPRGLKLTDLKPLSHTPQHGRWLPRSQVCAPFGSELLAKLKRMEHVEDRYMFFSGLHPKTHTLSSSSVNMMLCGCL